MQYFKPVLTPSQRCLTFAAALPRLHLTPARVLSRQQFTLLHILSQQRPTPGLAFPLRLQYLGL